MRRQSRERAASSPRGDGRERAFGQSIGTLEDGRRRVGGSPTTPPFDMLLSSTARVSMYRRVLELRSDCMVLMQLMVAVITGRRGLHVSVCVVNLDYLIDGREETLTAW